MPTMRRWNLSLSASLANSAVSHRLAPAVTPSAGASAWSQGTAFGVMHSDWGVSSQHLIEYALLQSRSLTTDESAAWSLQLLRKCPGVQCTRDRNQQR